MILLVYHNFLVYLAPNATINGDLTTIEGGDVKLTCDYVNVWPFGNTSVFNFKEVSVVLDKVSLL